MGLGVGALVPPEHLFRKPALHGRAPLRSVVELPVVHQRQLLLPARSSMGCAPPAGSMTHRRVCTNAA